MQNGMPQSMQREAWGMQHRRRKGFDELLPALLAAPPACHSAIGALDLQNPVGFCHACP